MNNCFLRSRTLNTGTMLVELAEKVLKLVGGKFTLTFQPLPNNDPKQLQPDIALAKYKLGWEPKGCLEDGLKESVTYFRKTLHV